MMWLYGWKPIIFLLYNNFFKLLQDSELVKLLRDARNCVNILNENLTLFVKVILVRLFIMTLETDGYN